MEELPKIPGFLTPEGISLLSFNKDFTQCALSKNDDLIYIYNIGKLEDINTWVLDKTLESHTQLITGLDWSPSSDLILSCSQDKSTIIWRKVKDEWKTSHLVATTKLGYLFASWNSRGDKLITGTSEKKLFVGYYNSKNKWWMSSNIKVHKSSVVCARIDPTSLFVLSGSIDLKIYVTSCYEPSVDDQFLTKETKPLCQEMGTPVFKFDCGSWVTSVAWSLSGNVGFASSQNANIVVIDYKKNKKEVIRLKHSPANYIFPINDTSFYLVGFDREIYLYEKGEKEWENKKIITREEENVKANAKPKDDNPENAKVSLVFEGFNNDHLHEADISSVTIKEGLIITTDFAGFVKYWKI